jgi:hypothetical protein
MSKPKNVIWVVADSVRYDSIFRPGEPTGLDYTLGHGTNFTQARSAGCWTLPATASMFTGLLPHEHGADTHSRKLKEAQTLAARLKELGYACYQVTANVATTHIFGLHNGFDKVYRVWDHMKLHWSDVGIHEILVIGSKPRMRKAVMSGDIVSKGFMEDMSASKIWLRSCIDEQLDLARQVVREHNARGQGVFLFVNIMEGHFPYHVDGNFRLLSDDWWNKAREMYGLFHLCNQTRLTTGKDYIAPDIMNTLRDRQRKAWLRIGPKVDEFVREMRDGGDPSTVLFCSDHGDNFGEAGWEYHFSNVNEAGNRTPLVWLRHDADAARTIEAPISMRDIGRSILAECGDPEWHLAEDPSRSQVFTESYWYSNHGKTLPQYKKNQFSFIAGERRFVHRDDAWHVAPVARDNFEPTLTLLKGGDPIEDSRLDAEKKSAAREAFRGFQKYSTTVASPKKN